MTKRERVLAAFKREPTDRPPYAFWRHFPNVDRAPAGLAQTTLRFHERYGSDFLKITPTGGYAVEESGRTSSPCVSCAVKDGDDWKKIRPLDPSSATGYAQQLEIIIRMGFDKRI